MPVSDIYCDDCTQACIDAYKHLIPNRTSKIIAFVDGTPTCDGIKKYPPNGIYEGYACTCFATCPTACKGQCGCEACSAAYSDFLSCE